MNDMAKKRIALIIQTKGSKCLSNIDCSKCFLDRKCSVYLRGMVLDPHGDINFYDFVYESTLEYIKTQKITNEELLEMLI